jgi:hypothetical protein
MAQAAASGISPSARSGLASSCMRFLSPLQPGPLTIRHRVQIDNTGKLKNNDITALAQRSGSSTAIEASTIYQYGSYYYLFTSWDKCCDGALLSFPQTGSRTERDAGTSSTYNIRVGRSSRCVPVRYVRGNIPTPMTQPHGRLRRQVRRQPAQERRHADPRYARQRACNRPPAAGCL